jgi:hypothetical protein
MASFTYTGNITGTDTVQATASVGGTPLASNVAHIGWITPLQPVATTTIWGRFFPSNGAGAFTATSSQQPAFSQTFPTINFNPPSGAVPGAPGSIGVNTRPMVDVTTDLNGNYTGSIVAQGNGYAAGTSLDPFNAVFTGENIVTSTLDVTFNFYSDDGFIFGVGNGATRVSGVLLNPPASGLTPFESLSVVGSYNTNSSPTANAVTVHFPGAGTYTYEIDYSECCGGQLALTVTTSTNGNHGVPLNVAVNPRRG